MTQDTSQTDDSKKARLNLVRYGMIAITAVAFIIAWLMPYSYASGLSGVPGYDAPGITAFLGQGVLVGVGIGVVCVIVYFAYAQYVKNQ